MYYLFTSQNVTKRGLFPKRMIIIFFLFLFRFGFIYSYIYIYRFTYANKCIVVVVDQLLVQWYSRRDILLLAIESR